MYPLADAASWKTLRAARLSIALSAGLIVTVSGCCYCGTFPYDLQSSATWHELERGLHSGPTSVDQEQTGVTIQLPVLFDSTTTQSIRPGTVVDSALVPNERVQPPGFTLPGLRFVCQAPYDGMPVTCYLAVVAKGNAEREKLKEQLLESAKKINPAAAWETVALQGSTLKAERLSLSGQQKFLPIGLNVPNKAIDADGRLDLYVVAGENANVLVGWRAPLDIAQRVSLFEAAEASIASIKSEKPAAPVATTPTETPEGPTGSYVQAPNTPVELVPPEGFTPSAAISGFEKSGTVSNIAVTPRPEPYSAMINSYSDATLKQYNISVLAREEVTIGDQPATLLLLQKPDQTYWNLVFGNDSGSFVVTGTLANANDQTEKDAMRSALLSSRRK